MNRPLQKHAFLQGTVIILPLLLESLLQKIPEAALFAVNHINMQKL